MPGYCVIGEADSFISMLLARFAQASGLEPVLARLGEDVYALARRLQPAVIFLDGELPGNLRGWEAARALRADADCRDIPLVSCSWLNETDARALLPDATAYLQKPELHYDDFVAALHLAVPIKVKVLAGSTAATASQQRSSSDKEECHG